MPWVLLFCLQATWIAWSDWSCRRIGNAPIVALMLTGLGVVALNGLPWSLPVTQAVLASALGLCGLLVFYAIGWMGAGDVKLAAALGAWLGVELLAITWILATLWALLDSVFYIALHKHFGTRAWKFGEAKRRLPFGTLLCVASMVVIWWKVLQGTE